MVGAIGILQGDVDEQRNLSIRIIITASRYSLQSIFLCLCADTRLVKAARTRISAEAKRDTEATDSVGNSSVPAGN
jgi:hypothetical protein